MRRDAYSILILGASQMQIPAIRIGKELGWRVIVADGNADAVGIPLADCFEHVDLKDREAMTDAARRHLEGEGLDGVFTAGTDFSATVAWVAEQLGLPGIPYQTALDASNKARMRRVFSSAGLASPRSVSLEKGDDPRSALAELEFPIVIKPVDNMGSRGVRRIDNEEELSSAFFDAADYSRSGRVILEQYMDGPEFSLDALVYNGEIELCGIADRHIFYPPYFVEMGHTMPSNFAVEEREMVIGLFFAGIRALGITLGAAKGDIKLSKNGPMIGEIAARLSGGYMSGWTYPYSSGVRVTEAAMRIAVGLPPGPLEPVKSHTAAERAFISIPGIVASIEGAEKAAELADEFFLRAEKGSEVRFPANNVEKCGNVICIDPDRAVAIRRAETARRAVAIRLTPFVKDTADFIFSRAAEWVPDAFVLSMEENVRALEKMPPTFGEAPERMEGIDIATLPALDAEDGREWHGEVFRRALNRVVESTGSRLVAPKAPESLETGRLVLGNLFWRAFLRGGIQGGVWLIESVGLVRGENDPRWAEVRAWSV